MFDENNLGGALEKAVSEANPTLKERLLRQRKGLQENLDKVDAAIQALEKNPDLEEFLNIMNRVTRL